MIKGITIITLSFVLVACSSKPPRVYWGNYSESLYELKKEPSPDNQLEHIEELEEIIAKSDNWHILPPPGVCAELGKLYLDTGKADQALALFNREAEIYPESQVLMSLILKDLQ